MNGRDAVVNAMSVDVEDYYQVSAFAGSVDRATWNNFPSRVEDNTRRTLDLFAEYAVRATFFTLGCVAERHKGLVRAIAEAGHEVASHGWEHYRVGDQDPAEFRADVTRTKKVLEDLSGQEVKGYRAASFSINRRTWWAFDELAEAGYRYSSSIHPIRHDHYGVPDAPRFPFAPVELNRLTEIPVGTLDVGGLRMSCAGGGFFRLLPYQWSSFAIGKVNRAERQPVTFYFHPWEIDPAQPRISTAPLRSKLRHYTNLGVMEAKLKRLLREFRWDRVDAVYGLSRTVTSAGPEAQSFIGPEGQSFIGPEAQSTGDVRRRSGLWPNVIHQRPEPHSQ
jgi:polysaccharide deacetylase family protein (PEP-CTERM system associated)